MVVYSTCTSTRLFPMLVISTHRWPLLVGLDDGGRNDKVGGDNGKREVNVKQRVCTHHPVKAVVFNLPHGHLQSCK